MRPDRKKQKPDAGRRAIEKEEYDERCGHC
jgi:hypothetical protein